MTCKLEDIFDDALETYNRKNNDYGNSFSLLYREYGMLSVVIRLSDKINRLKALEKADIKQRVKDESIEDTLEDLMNYAAMTLLERRKIEAEKHSGFNKFGVKTFDRAMGTLGKALNNERGK
jgi:hypothetical protein